VEYFHPLVEPITKVTLGAIVYQEQVMQIAREVGQLSWEDDNGLRKAMSKSMGQEIFEQYWKRFLKGAKTNGLNQEEAQIIWSNLSASGGYAFNRSHAVAYGMVSYWCAVLKAHHPVAFAAATLRHAKDEEQVIKVLRELVTEGHEYIPVDPEKSLVNWSHDGNRLLGGLTNVKGIGPVKAEKLIAKRESGLAWTAGEAKLLTDPVTPFDQLYECRKLWGHIFDNPQEHKVFTRILESEDISQDTKGEFVFIGKLKERIQRDHNDEKSVARRNGKILTGPSLYLSLVLSDDFGDLSAQIARFQFSKWSQAILDGKIGDWYMLRGFIRGGYRKMTILKVRKLVINA
jgi:hypothetical protein